MHSPSYNKSQMFLVHVFCLEKKKKHTFSEYLQHFVYVKGFLCGQIEVPKYISP